MKPAKRNQPTQTKIVDPPQKNQRVEFKHTSLFIGPLPSPDLLAKYEDIHPGIAERILQMAEKEQVERHRQEQQLIEMERKNQRSLNWNVIRGQVLAFFSVLVISALCAYFAFLGDIPTAGKTAIWVIVSLAAVFITGRILFKKTPPKD